MSVRSLFEVTFGHLSKSPQTMPKRDESHMAARRAQILDAARVAIDREGLEFLSMARISSAAGLSIGALYTHFESRQALLAELIKSDPQSRPLFRGCKTAPETLQRFAEMLSELALRDETNIRLRVTLELAALARRSPEVRGAVDQGYQGQRSAVMQQMSMLAHDGLAPERVAVIGECLFALLLSAQFQMMTGVVADNDAMLLAARNLLEEIHGGPFTHPTKRRHR